MKKIFLGFCTLVFVSAAHAQIKSRVSFGPTLGVGHSWTSADHVGNVNNKFFPLYAAGLAMIYSADEHWGIGADLKYSSEGEKYPTDPNDDNDYRKIRINYLRIPVKGIYFFGDYGDKMRPKVAVGPTLGFRLGGENEIYVDDREVSQVSSKSFTESFDIGVQIGGGINFRISPAVWLNTDISYYHGLKDIYTVEGKLRNLALNVGLQFGIR